MPRSFYIFNTLNRVLYYNKTLENKNKPQQTKFISKYLLTIDESLIGINVTTKEFENDLKIKKYRFERELKLFNDYRPFRELLCHTRLYLYTGRIYQSSNDTLSNYTYDKDCNVVTL